MNSMLAGWVTTEQKMKKCTKCLKEKPLAEFEAKKQTSTGYGSRCKKCATAIHKKYRPPVAGITKPRKQSIKDTWRQEQIVKYGIAVVEAMEALHDF